MIESLSFHRVSIKDHEILLKCRPVIFQRAPLIVPYLHNNCQKQTHFLNGHLRQCGPFFIQCVQVLAMISICLCHQHLYNLKKKKPENAHW